ncbi:MAG: hypothetical protein WKF43_07390 [Acidimicrobiales bacterium]
MPVFLLLGLLALAVLVGVALWSDRRDRRAGIDPRVRVAHLEQRRRRLRDERTDRRVRRYLIDGTDPRDRQGRA